MGLRILRQFLRLPLSAFPVLATAVSTAFKSRPTLQVENLALRHQLGVLRRSVKRPKLSSADRLLWAWLSESWSDWRSALVLVKPETVITWHRKGFRLFWTWKVRHGRPGRPAVPKDVRELIRKMSRENPLWGAPPIHGELRKLGIDIGETSVGKYIVRRPKPPSQTWRTFLDNHVKTFSRLLPLSEHKSLEFIAESTNIMNTLNVTNLNTTAQVDTLGDIIVAPPNTATASRDQRLVQMGVRFNF
jgi:hypothetical protein